MTIGEARKKVITKEKGNRRRKMKKLTLEERAILSFNVKHRPYDYVSFLRGYYAGYKACQRDTRELRDYKKKYDLWFGAI